MNARCYRCGWSFSLNREEIEEAAVASAGQKAHVMHCPRCRQAIRIPMDQISQALPPGWTPPTPSSAPAAAVTEPVAAETSGDAQAVSEPAESAVPTERRSERRHRHSSKANSGNSAAVPAAKKSTHPN